jgi:hypothetical protein
MKRGSRSVFSGIKIGNLGNLELNSYTGPAGFYSDLSAVKKFRLTERLSGQFRMDAFNIFNHPVYAFRQNNGANGCIDCQGGNNGKITLLKMERRCGNCSLPSASTSKIRDRGKGT